MTDDRCPGLVSVVVPAFNAERWIAETLQSVLVQSYGDLEVIVVDDGSTDDTADILRRYSARDSRVRYLRQANRGPGAARNVGISEARGEYLAFIDADDLWAPDKIELQMAVLRSRSDSAVITGIQRFRDTDAGREWLSRTEAPLFGRRVDALHQVLLLRNDQMALFTTALFRTEELAALGGYAERIGNAEDWELWLRAARTLSFTIVQQPLLLYRKHDTSATARTQLESALCFQLSLIARENLKGGVSKTVLRIARRNKLLEFAEAAVWRGDLRLACKCWTSGLLLHSGMLSAAYYQAVRWLAGGLLRRLRR